MTMDKCFVRSSWYVDPPAKNATKEEWEQWLEADAKEAKAAKIRFARSRKSQRLECTSDLSVAKINGVYRQVPALGFVEQGGGRLEPIVEAAQEQEVENIRQDVNAFHRRGGSRQYRNKNKREQIRMARKAKYRSR